MHHMKVTEWAGIDMNPVELLVLYTFDIFDSASYPRVHHDFVAAPR